MGRRGTAQIKVKKMKMKMKVEWDFSLKEPHIVTPCTAEYPVLYSGPAERHPLPSSRFDATFRPIEDATRCDTCCGESKKQKMEVEEGPGRNDARDHVTPPQIGQETASSSARALPFFDQL